MSGNSMGLHEPIEKLRPLTVDMHRAIVSLQEELEAVDWYQQRAEACQDPELRDILMHNMDEEVEHAMMALEWLRRRHPSFQKHMRTYLFTAADITEIEDADTSGEDAPAAPASAAPPSADPAGRRATIGSLRRRRP